MPLLTQSTLNLVFFGGMVFKGVYKLLACTVFVRPGYMLKFWALLRQSGRFWSILACLGRFSAKKRCCSRAPFLGVNVYFMHFLAVACVIFAPFFSNAFLGQKMALFWGVFYAIFGGCMRNFCAIFQQRFLGHFLALFWGHF